MPLFRAFADIINSIVLHRAAQGIISDMRKGLYRQLMRLSMRFYDQTPTGAINQRLFGDVGSVIMRHFSAAGCFGLCNLELQRVWAA